MQKRLKPPLLVGLVMIFVSIVIGNGRNVGAVLAAPGVQITEPVPSGEGWLATYWNNTDLSGDPVLVRNETTIDYVLGLSSPAISSVAVDHYSARWERALRLAEGRYRFTLTVDDGARLWVNGRLFIDAWEVQSENTYTGEIYIAGGTVPLTLEYFENTGISTIVLAWEPVDIFVDGWQGEYFNNKTLSSTPTLIRVDPAIEFDWGADSPAPALIDPESFSARWTRTLALPAGQYRFTVTADDGVRLWVDDQLLIDKWQTQSATSFSREITLSAGGTPVELTYFENGGLARIALSWQRIHDAPTPTGTLVPTTSAGFVSGGPAEEWYTDNEDANNAMLWTYHHSNSEDNYNWARWYPSLTAGVYEVQAFIPNHFATTESARYWISHANGYEVREVNQAANRERWVTLGSFVFEGTGSDFVSLADVTFEREADGLRMVAYDAVRWLPVENESNATAQVSLSPTEGEPGTQVTAVALGFPPNQPIFLRLGPTNTEPFGQYGQSETDSEGNAEITFVIPSTWPNGTPLSGEPLVALAITNNGAQATADFGIRP